MLLDTNIYYIHIGIKIVKYWCTDGYTGLNKPEKPETNLAH